MKMDSHITETPKVKAKITVLTKEEGGRGAIYDSLSYRPHIVIGDTKVRKATLGPDGKGNENYLGICFLGEGKELVQDFPYEVEFALIYHPSVDYSAVEEGAEFTVREGSHVVAYGKVLSVGQSENS